MTAKKSEWSFPWDVSLSSNWSRLISSRLVNIRVSIDERKSPPSLAAAFLLSHPPKFVVDAASKLSQKLGGRKGV